MNLLYTAVGEYIDKRVERNLAHWRRRQHLVEYLEWSAIPQYLLLGSTSHLAQIDAIVCNADAPWQLNPVSRKFDFYFPLDVALWLLSEIRQLPANCAMRDGRKWRSVPFIIFYGPNDYFRAEEARKSSNVDLEFLPQSQYIYPELSLYKVEQVVENDRKRVLRDYVDLGILVHSAGGRIQVSPALRKTSPYTETDLYYPSADRRKKNGWVTYYRDKEGLRLDIEEFRALLDAGANEREIHNFFDLHPLFLSQARRGLPLSHQPRFIAPLAQTPDITVTSILGPLDGKLDLIELKGPAEPFIREGAHGGFSSRVTKAVDQVRDYDRYMRDPRNFKAIIKGLGFLPKHNRLAVLIGRAPRNLHHIELRQRRQEELDVEIVTYDEILSVQESQMIL